MVLNAHKSFSFAGLLLITVTECPFSNSDCVSGLLICPNKPVIIIFNFQFLDDAKVCFIQETGVTVSTFVVSKTDHGLSRSKDYTDLEKMTNQIISISLFCPVFLCNPSIRLMRDSDTFTQHIYIFLRPNQAG